MENEIREFFRQTAPKPSDPTAFKLELNARLAAVEQIKAFHDREVRRLRRIRRLTFAAGLLLGGAAAAFFIVYAIGKKTWAKELAELDAKKPEENKAL